MDLFEASLTADSAVAQPSVGAPLAVRLRPRTVDEVLGQDHLLEAGSPLRRLLSGSSGMAGVSSVVLWGPPGVGKTTLALLIARDSGRRFAQVSAVESGVAALRKVINEAKAHLLATGEETVLFVDEVHRFSKSQQDALLPAVENGWVTLIAATTENPSFCVIAPLLSRSLLLTLNSFNTQSLNAVIDRALSHERGFNGRFTLSPQARESLLRLCGGDARRVLTLLEASAGAAEDVGVFAIDTDHVQQAADAALVRYGQDEHYDVISAFIKSMRGSDVDAAIHYLARMVEAGEDPRYIARRIVICASEDVGMADPQALAIATDAARAVAFVGMPEARIILAQAVIAVATAPKSNAAYVAIDRAIADVRAGKIGSVPMHLRDGHYQGAERLGHGKGYEYAHDAEHAIAAQQYLPDELEGREYYSPTERGFEAVITSRLAKVRARLKMR
ncbi:MAG: replication-associated recombination protein A [Actinomycetaceae bacterium]|nr:replication-associated recombination protein A [Actinomycetaceae bacterium]